MRYSYSKESLLIAIQSSFSIREALMKLNMKAAGGNYATIKKHIKNYNIDTSHFTGKIWNAGKVFGPKRPITDYLENKAFIQSHALKKRLIKESILLRQCDICKLTEWLGLPMPLELHHKDGYHDNNNLSNLQLLCPNCHSLTDNYRGRKIKVERIKNRIILPPKHCCDCNVEIGHGRTTRCRSCAGKFCNKTKINWPTTEELIKMVNQSNFVQVGKQLGVSDNSIRQRIKRHPIK